MRLINAQPLYERFCDLEGGAMRHVSELYDKGKELDFKMWSAILAERTAYKHDIIDAPTIDAVPVVRCASCRFAEYVPGPMDYLCRRNGGCFQGDEYCSRGKRREDGDRDG